MHTPLLILGFYRQRKTPLSLLFSLSIWLWLWPWPWPWPRGNLQEIATLAQHCCRFQIIWGRILCGCWLPRVRMRWAARYWVNFELDWIGWWTLSNECGVHFCTCTKWLVPTLTHFIIVTLFMYSLFHV